MFGHLVALIEKADDGSEGTDGTGVPEVVTQGGVPGDETQAAQVEGLTLIESTPTNQMGTSATPSGPVVGGSGFPVGAAVVASGEESPTGYASSPGIGTMSPVHSGANVFEEAPRYSLGAQASTSSGGAGLTKQYISRIAELEVQVGALDREHRFSQEQLAKCEVKSGEQLALLHRLKDALVASLAGNGGEGEVAENATIDSLAPSAIKEDPEQLVLEAAQTLETLGGGVGACHGKDFIITSTMERLESIIDYNASTIAALTQSNTSLREQLLQQESSYEGQLEGLRSELEESGFEAKRFKEVVKESDRRREETTKMSQRLVKLGSALEQKSIEAESSEMQVSHLMTKIHERDAELEQLRTSSSAGGNAQTEELQKTKIFLALSAGKQSKALSLGSQGLVKAASFLDTFSLQTGRLLNGNAALRLFIAFYLVLLHVYLFHVVTSVVHLMPTVGHDVHDHINNHLHHEAGK